MNPPKKNRNRFLFLTQLVAVAGGFLFLGAPSYHHFLFPQVTNAQKTLQCSPLLSCLCPRWFLFLARLVESPRWFLFLGRFLVWGQFLFFWGGVYSPCNKSLEG